MAKSRAEVLEMLNDNQVLFSGSVAQNGKKYIQAKTGSVKIGAEAVKYVAGTTRRGGVTTPDTLQVVGKITSEGESFLTSTKEAGILRGEANPADMYETRYYID